MRKALLTILMCMAALVPAQAEDARFSLGGDSYAAGQSSAIGQAVPHDAFVAGFDTSLGGKVGGDAHMAGFNVTADQAVDGDLYAAGFSVVIAQAIGGDVTAFGNSVTVQPGAAIAGNARLSGASVNLSAPVTGAALVSAETLNLNAAVAGDFEFFGNKIVFGPAARIGGIVRIHAPAAIEVPGTVAAADKVTFEVLEATDYAGQAGKTAEHVVSGVWPAVWAVVLWWTALIVFGALALALLPRATAAFEERARSRPLRTIGLGILGFAAAIGLVPVAAITIIGIVLLPFIAIAAFIACVLAYLAGVYLLAVRVGNAFMKVDSLPKRLGLLVAGVILAGLIGMLPFLGWLISLLLLTYGFGIFTRSLTEQSPPWTRRGPARSATPEAV
ncbi:hypothetical protein [Devosia salina]|uniref:DUF8173 domain-containing protein n=1 Tax=Devosia salina TaxID=2860336 RepID=A0ABX8WHG0_9HYPH|nr:hypothetical protein [Devosia salina]QYO78310.1 hypothetical protein K1X15_07095 [Devosia salina]